MKSKIRLYFADEAPMMVYGIRSMFASHPRILVSGSACDGGVALFEMMNSDFDVCMIDISMPSMDGMAILAKVLRSKPSARVLFFSDRSESSYAVRLMHLGAYGFLKKKSDPEEIEHAIIKVAGGSRYFGDDATNAMLMSLSNVSRNNNNHDLFGSDTLDYTKFHDARLRNLTHREFEIMYMIGKLNTPGSIATSLNISPKTVSTHVSSILRKLDLERREDLIHYTIVNKIVD